MSISQHAHGLRPTELQLPTSSEQRSLGPLLAMLDAGALVLAATIVAVLEALTSPRVIDTGGPWFVVVLTVLGLLVIGAAGLHQRRKCAIASVEISRIGRATAAGGILALLLLQAADSSSPYITAFAISVSTLITLVLTRTWFRAWLKGQRLQGRFTIPVAVVGQRGAAQDFARHLRAHLDSGFMPVAHVDVDPRPLMDLTDDAEQLPRVGYLHDDLESDLDDAGVGSAVLLADGLTGDDLRSVVRATEKQFSHVQVVTNLVGVSHARLVPTPLVGEMTFYLEPLASNWQRVIKRAMDVLGAGALLLLTAPLQALIALAVWLPDRGPVLYAQERIGRDSEPIQIRKFRSMVVDADQLQDDLREQNERAGPLFKARRDPRVTRVGRWLRATSLDELPQLWSILVGDMSLVGPRPALPAEVAEFDHIHQRRHEVRPGLTGLWQVEDRDHPDFERYRRHDVFYVDNWSLSLDLAILLQTAAVVLRRGVRVVHAAVLGRSGEVLE